MHIGEHGSAPAPGVRERPGAKLLRRREEISGELEARIAAGEWPPGAAIPSEKELSTCYCVSVGTVRRAIDPLVDKGLLRRRQGSGTYVGGPRAARQGRLLLT